MADKSKKSSASSGAPAKKGGSSTAKVGCNPLYEDKVNPRWLAEKLGVSRQAIVKRMAAMTKKGTAFPLEDPKGCLDLLASSKSAAGRPGGAKSEARGMSTEEAADKARSPFKGQPLPASSGGAATIADLPKGTGMDGALARAEFIENLVSNTIAEAISKNDQVRLASMLNVYPKCQMNLSMQSMSSIKFKESIGKYVDKQVFLDAVTEILSDLGSFLRDVPKRYSREANPKEHLVAQAALESLVKAGFSVIEKAIARIEESKC